MAVDFVSESDAPIFTEEREILDRNPETEGILIRYRQPVQKKTENDNGRVYTDQFWKEAVFNDEKTQQRIERGLMVGQLSHPESGVKVNPENLSHRVSELVDGARNENLQDDLIYGTVEVYDTPGGNILDTLVRSETKIGQSSRALVDYHNEAGTEVITDGDLRGFDAVLGPSVVEALPPDVSKEDIEDFGDEGDEVDLSEELESVASQIRQYSQENDSAKLVCESIDNYEENLDMADDYEKLLEDKKEEVEDLQSKIERLQTKIEDKDEDINELEQEINNKENKIEDLREQVESNSDENVITVEQAQERVERVRKESKRMMKNVLEDIREVAVPEDQAVEKVKELVEFIDSLKEKVNEDYIRVDEYKGKVEELKTRISDLKQAGKEGIKDVINKAEQKVQSARQELQEKGIRMVMEYRLKALGFEDDQEMREHILSSDSIQEAENRADQLQGFIEDGYTETEIHNHIGTSKFENETTKRTYERVSSLG